MILKLPKEINRKVRSNNLTVRYHLCDTEFSHTHLGIFSYFGKEFFSKIRENT